MTHTRRERPGYGSVLYFRLENTRNAREELEGRRAINDLQSTRIVGVPERDLWMSFRGDPDGNTLQMTSEVYPGP